MKNKRGFTLIELMAVVVIISLIAILTFPNIINQINKSKDANKSNINSVVIAAAKKYVADNPSEFEENEYCLSIDTLVSNDYVKEDIFKDSDILNKKVIKLATEKSKYEIMDKDKCKIYDYFDKDGNGYAKIDYLESTGRQYIDTGFKPNQDTKVEIDFEVLESQTEIYFGSRFDYNADTYSLLQVNNKIRSDYAQTMGEQFPSHDISTIDTYPRFTIVKDKNTTSINNSFSSSLSYSNFQSNYNMYIFAANEKNYPSRLSNIRLYSFKLYDNNTLIRDYVPAIDEKNELCLFDKVNKKCYYNKGDGDFVNDSALNNITYYDKNGNKYSKINYIESNGTQYIDTNFKPNQDTKVEVDFEVLKSKTEIYFGSRNDYTTNTYSFVQFQNRFRSDYSQSNINFSQIITEINTYPKFSIIKDKNITILNNSITLSHSYSNFQSNYNMYIFAANEQNNPVNFSAIKLYSFKMYDNNSLIRDLIPVLDPHDIPCLYDKVDKKCYYNQGTGEFLYG